MTTAITSRDEMEQAFEQLERLYQSLAALRRQIEPANPRNFAVLAEGHLEHIRRLRRELDEYAGVMALDEQAAPLWLRVVGPEIEWPAAPTSVLTAILDAFRKGVQSVAELILTGELTTRPTAELKRATDFRVVAMAPGSLRVGVQLPFEEGKVAEAVSRALGDYLKTAAWVASDRPDEELHAQVPDERRRRLLLTEISRLAPRERGQVEEVELVGSLLQSERILGPITLARKNRRRINETLDKIPEQRIETYTGDLREIDLDKCSFVLRNIEASPGEAMQIECQFREELLEAAKEALDKRVTVTGSRPIDQTRRPKSLLVSRLEIVEDREL
jgi:hypothetical protein